MTIFQAVVLSTLIYIILIIPMAIGVGLMYYVGKKLELGDISIGNIFKSIGFYFLSGSIFFSIFSIFTVNPFANFSYINNSPYFSIIILLILLSIIALFVVLHFKTFNLFIKKFYDLDLSKQIFLYCTTGVTVYFLVQFYLPAIQIFLGYTQLALAK